MTQHPSRGKGRKMSRQVWIGAIVLSIAGAGTTARAQSLGIGDPAPKLEVKSFVKGEPVKRSSPARTTSWSSGRPGAGLVRRVSRI